jgi:hypothetical protein
MAHGNAATAQTVLAVVEARPPAPPDAFLPDAFGDWESGMLQADRAWVSEAGVRRPVQRR